jgi:hypothetical protein
MGIGFGLTGTALFTEASFYYRSLVDRLFPENLSSLVIIGVSSYETGFIERHDLSSVFLAGGERLDIGDPDDNLMYVNALIVFFEQRRDAYVGISVNAGYEWMMNWSSGVAGSYFAEIGAAAFKNTVVPCCRIGMTVRF